MEDKKVYLEKLEAKFKKIENKIDQLKDEAGKAYQQEREKYQEEIDELLDKKLKLQEKLNELKNTGIGNWNNLSQNFEDHLQKLDIAFANFKKKLGI